MSSKRIEKTFELFRTIVAIFIALGIALVVVTFVSENPVDAINKFLLGPLSSTRRFANVIELMIPFTFTALGICTMYQANQFNLIGEGVFFFGGAIATYVAINTDLPVIIHPAVCIIVAGIVGAMFASIPAILKVKWKANEVVSSIMMNYILQFGGLYLFMYHMKDIKSGYNASYLIPTTAKLPVIVPKTRIHFGAIIAIAFIIIVYVFIYKTKWGYAIRLTGANPSFSTYSGITITSVILYSQIIGGFLAGIGGAVEILGIYTRFQWEALPGYGWDGMLVGILAKNNPALVPIAAFFLAYLRVGADIVARSTDVPVEFVSVIQAIVIMLVAAELFLSGLKHKVIVKHSQKELEMKEEDSWGIHL